MAALYVGSQYGLPYFRYYRFKSDVSDMVKFPGSSAEDIKARILEKAAQDGVALDPDDVHVRANGLHFEAQASWSEEVNLFDRYKKQLNFAFDVNAGGGN